MNDLSQLFELNPYVASGFTGQREALSQGYDQLKNQELAQLIDSRMQDARFKADLHPLDVANKGLVNQGLEADLPGKRADSRIKATAAALGEGTLESDIQAKKTKNATEGYTQVGYHLGSIAQQLEGVSDIEAPQVLSNALDTLGAGPKMKQALLNRYGRYPAAVMMQKMQEDSDRILAENPAMAQAGLETSAGFMRERMRLESAERIRNAEIAAGRYDTKSTKAPFSEAEAWQKRVAEARSAKERHSAALGAAQFFEAQGDDRRAGYYDKIAEDARPQAERELASGAEKPGSVNVQGVTKGQVPTNPELPLSGRGGAKPPTPPASAPNGGRVRIISPDGKVGTIPANQLEQALKQGYKRQ